MTRPDVDCAGRTQSSAACDAIPATAIVAPKNPAATLTHVEGVALHAFPSVRDARGVLSVCEFERDIPFQPKRYFLVFDVPSSEIRGQHAHRKCHQFLVSVAGSVSVLVDDGIHREQVQLDRPNVGLLIPAGIWGVQYNYSAGAVLLVLASEHYDREDYIRDYKDFLEFRGAKA